MIRLQVLLIVAQLSFLAFSFSLSMPIAAFFFFIKDVVVMSSLGGVRTLFLNVLMYHYFLLP